MDAVTATFIAAGAGLAGVGVTVWFARGSVNKQIRQGIDLRERDYRLEAIEVAVESGIAAIRAVDGFGAWLVPKHWERLNIEGLLPEPEHSDEDIQKLDQMREEYIGQREGVAAAVLAARARLIGLNARTAADDPLVERYSKFLNTLDDWLSTTASRLTTRRGNYSDHGRPQMRRLAIEAFGRFVDACLGEASADNDGPPSYTDKAVTDALMALDSVKREPW